MSYLAQVDVLKTLPTNTDQEKLFKAYALGAAFTAEFFCDIVNEKGKDHKPIIEMALMVGSLIIKKYTHELGINPEVYMNLIEQRLLKYAEQGEQAESKPRINLN